MFGKNETKIDIAYLPNFFRNSDSHNLNNICQGCSHMFLHFGKYFGDKYVVRGSRFGENFGSSKNDPKNIAIDQESLIKHFGIIKTQKKTINM